MRTANEMLEERLREIDPLDGRVPHGQDRREQELLEAILASDPKEASESRPVPGARSDWTRRRRLLAPVAIAAVALLALVIGLPGGGGGDPKGLPALERVAVAAASQPSPLAGLPYLYVKTRQTGIETSVAHGQNWSNYHSEIDEEWIAEDGSGRLRRVVAPTRFVGPRDRKAWEAADKINFLAHGWGRFVEDKRVPEGTFDDQVQGGGVSLSELPTDPAELADWLTQRAENPKYGGGAWPLSIKTLDLAAEFLRNPLATPELRAALYEAEALIPGIRYLGPASDEIGRRGVAVGANSSNSGAPTLYSLIFDPRTSQVLATEQTWLVPPKSFASTRGKTLSSTKVFVDSGPVRTLHNIPPP